MDNIKQSSQAILVKDIFYAVLSYNKIEVGNSTVAIVKVKIVEELISNNIAI